MKKGIKEHFLDSKSKKVLKEMCKVLEIEIPKIHKTPKFKIKKRLLEFSNSQLRKAYWGTFYGYHRKQSEEELKKYPDDIGIKMNLEKMDRLKQ